MATNVVMGSFTWTFAGTWTWGTDAAGKAWVEIPTGSDNIIAITPVQITDGFGDVINGSEKNPQRTSDPLTQGYDERSTSFYSAALTVSLPLSVTAGDIIVSTKSTSVFEDRHGKFDEIGAVHIVASAPTGEYLLPASVGWSGRVVSAPYTVDIDSWYSGRPVYSSEGITFPSYATLAGHIDRFYPLYSQVYATVGGYENSSPYEFGDSSQSLPNYGRYIGQVMAVACAALISDAYTESETKALARRVIQHGIEWNDPALYSGIATAPDGGHQQFHQGAAAFALYMTGRQDEIPDIMTQNPGNWDQPFEYTTANIASTFSRHTDPTKPCFWRERTLPAQTGTSTQVTVPYTNSANQGDWYQIYIPIGARVVRVSDGVSATVSVAKSITNSDSGNGSSGTFQLDLDSANPFSPGDVVHYDAPDGWVAAGKFDWAWKGCVNQFTGDAHMFSPAATNAYRSLQSVVGMVLMMKALDILPSAFGAVLGYMLRSIESDVPSANNDYPAQYGEWKGGSTIADFYSAHSAAIFSTAPPPKSYPSSTLSALL